MSITKRNFSIHEYCLTYNYGRSMAYRDIASGDLQIIKVGNRTLIPVEFAESLQKRRMTQAGSVDISAA